MPTGWTRAKRGGNAPRDSRPKEEPGIGFKNVIGSGDSLGPGCPQVRKKKRKWRWWGHTRY